MLVPAGRTRARPIADVIAIHGAREGDTPPGLTIVLASA